MHMCFHLHELHRFAGAPEARVPAFSAFRFCNTCTLTCMGSTNLQDYLKPVHLRYWHPGATCYLIFDANLDQCILGRSFDDV